MLNNFVISAGITVETTCECTHNGSEGLIYTPDFHAGSSYDPANNCQWTIVSRSGGPITIDFNYFDAYGVEIIDGSSKRTRSGNIVPSQIVSDGQPPHGDTVEIKFASGQISAKGFEISYSHPGN